MRFVLTIGFCVSLAIPYIPRPTVQHPHHITTTSERRWSDVGLYYVGQQLVDVTAQLNNVIADRDAKAVQVAELEQKVASLQAVSTGVGSGSAVPPSVGGNHFPWGFCTWYVASRRYVPWYGDAITWLSGARAYGYTTGSSPRVGAIMVTAESNVGHVAYVESINPLVVSEMNFVRFGFTDRRLVASSVPILGFIY